MSLSDPDGRAAGQRTVNGTLTYYYDRSDTGQHSSGPVTYNRYSRLRGGNSSSPVSILPNSKTPWRRPTSFARSITWFQPGDCTVKVTYSPSRTDTYTESTLRLVAQNAAMNEMLPAFTGTSSLPEYDYNDRARAITECLLKLGNQKAQFSASLATAGQTVNMIAGAAGRLWKTLLDAKRGNWGALPKDLGLGPGGPGVAGYWLEYQYGWKPLMDDLYAARQLFDKLEPEAMIISAKRVINGNYSYDRRTAAENGIWANWKTNSKYSTTCHLYGRVKDSWLRAGSQYGLINPASLAWELVPWSFLVDWSLPIGNFLEAFTATAGLEFIGGYTSRWAQGQTIINFDLSGQIYPWNSYTVGKHQIDRFGFRRDALSDWPLPLPYVKSPFSNAHTANALALLKQLLK